ncbi:hypothetical protein niasHT_012572 [Heterodera trifolii]|uniref:J domain-containing protein n=1 Tax=Heterodera trifolii TaxID=157864 RepID=A0ABD2L1A5_9BILA
MPSNKNDFFSSSENNFKYLRPYEWLCVPKNASHALINKNYKKLAMATHPDKNKQCSGKLFMLISYAKDDLLGRSRSCGRMEEEDNHQQQTNKSNKVFEKRVFKSCPKNAAADNDESDDSETSESEPKKTYDADNDDSNDSETSERDEEFKIADEDLWLVYKMLRPYEWLCVPKNATHAEINKNYKKLSIVTHPDKNNKCSDKLFTLITHAKEELLRRPKYSGRVMGVLLQIMAPE